MTLLIDIPTADEYPTRKAHEPALLYRRSPTVWGSADGGPFSAEQIADYDRRGYTQIDSLVSGEEVQAYRAELERLAADPALRGDDRVVVDPESGTVQSVYGVHGLSDVFSALVNDPRLVERARQILGSDVYVHQSRVNHKPGFGGGSFFWHSNFETWHAEDGMPRMRAVSFSIALTENYPHNGALMAIPGSHRTFVSCVDPSPSPHHRNPPKTRGAGVPDESSLSLLAHQHGIEVLTGPAGGATVFDSNCMHGSGDNITPHPRSDVFVVFNSVHNACTTPFGSSGPRPEHVASRDFSPAGR
ncbi:ectoine hydroxylase [Nocardiopsis sp. NPDC058631]|uniref:ectoine hydroxylase n=1 Tax=Nocardiopsis sp. NPDC058631 TaxID=3346566 RepID=UPI0036472E00